MPMEPSVPGRDAAKDSVRSVNDGHARARCGRRAGATREQGGGGALLLRLHKALTLTAQSEISSTLLSCTVSGRRRGRGSPAAPPTLLAQPARRLVLVVVR